MAFSDVTVVVPVDFSQQSDFAVKSALAIAADPKRLHVVHVLVPLDTVSPGVLLGHITNETRSAAVKKNIAKLVEQQSAAGACEEVLIGDPGL